MAKDCIPPACIMAMPYTFSPMSRMRNTMSGLVTRIKKTAHRSATPLRGKSSSNIPQIRTSGVAWPPTSTPGMRGWNSGRPTQAACVHSKANWSLPRCHSPRRWPSLCLSTWPYGGTVTCSARCSTRMWCRNTIGRPERASLSW